MRGSERVELRNRTRDAHQRVDAAVGELSTIEDYRRYVARVLPFRATMDEALRNVSWPEGWNWRPSGVAELLAQDACDLGLAPARRIRPDFDLSDPSALLGALYVVEGSSLGARVLRQRALKLGFDETFGAKHLASMANDTTRWPSFLSLLERTRDFDVVRSAVTANAVFALAQTCFESTYLVAS
ncbi:biliverdin-producing heme oxygenase [Ensifer adhaerens]|uniref:biliverdin-producing heme oxygenase n=1 Tax=Ensifer TaxID=106591 RepID=UPI000883C08B|nr:MULTISPECIES: biliverdin-producing heme oxygenase [unclassified Ensifer]SDN25581.1 heme oxygenase [Ensifer sp. YR511]